MSQPESKLSRSIMTALRQRGVWCMKIHGGPLTLVGAPDIVACYKGRFLALETKMPTGKLHGRQAYVLATIRRAGGVVAVPRSVSDALDVLNAIDDGGAIPHEPTDELRAALE